MATRVSATDAARTFSELLNRVSAGEEFEVTRSGAPVALIAPARDQLLAATRFRELLSTAPPPDDDLAEELRAARRSIPEPVERWRS